MDYIQEAFYIQKFITIRVMHQTMTKSLLMKTISLFLLVPTRNDHFRLGSCLINVLV